MQSKTVKSLQKDVLFTAPPTHTDAVSALVSASTWRQNISSNFAPFQRWRFLSVQSHWSATIRWCLKQLAHVLLRFRATHHHASCQAPYVSWCLPETVLYSSGPLRPFFSSSFSTWCLLGTTVCPVHSCVTLTPVFGVLSIHSMVPH